MKKVLVTLSLLGFLSTPAMAATSTYCQPCVPTGGAATVGPTVQPVTIQKKRWWQRKRTGYIPVCPCVTGGAAAVCPLPTPCKPQFCDPCATGGAAGINSNIEPVLVTKRHFWEKDKIEMMQINPASTGCAVTSCPTGCAAPCPTPSPAPCPCPKPCPTPCPTCLPTCPDPCVEPCPTPCPNPCVEPCPSGAASEMPYSMPRREIIKQKLQTQKGTKTGGAAPIRGYW